MRLVWICVLVMWPLAAVAELQSLFRAAPTAAVGTEGPASLFRGRSQGMFAPLPERVQPTSARLSPRTGGTGSTPIDQLLTLIARAEAGSAGYDAVQYGATVRPAKRPTQMTLGEIYDWIDATPGQPHAIGRYQFIPPTLRRVATIRGFGSETRFTPGVQDALALVLLEDAGLTQFRSGDMDRLRFMHNLARIWAGLPLPNGQSYYDGYAANKATMTWAAFDGGMRAIWGG